MRYDDSKERSAEYLRLALPYMSQQSAALHPVSYAVWYEYVSGRNASLRTEIDSLTRNGDRLDEAKTTGLFRKHISEVNEALATLVGQGLQKVMSDMSRSASEAGDEAERFGDVLEKKNDHTGGCLQSCQSPEARPANERRGQCAVEAAR